jgi:hypothetical protein
VLPLNLQCLTWLQFKVGILKTVEQIKEKNGREEENK